MRWPQSMKDAGYLEFLAHEIGTQTASINGLKLSVISRELRLVAKRIRENYEDRS